MTENLPPQDEPQPPQPQQQPPPEQAWWPTQGPVQPQYSVPIGPEPIDPAPTGTVPTGTLPTENPPQSPPRPQRRVSGAIVATAVVAGLIGGGVSLGGAALLADGPAAPVLTSQPPPAASQMDTQPGSVSHAAAIATKFTVDIQVPVQQGSVTGTGIILSPDGYVLTNNHVVAGAQNGQIRVTTPDGNKLSATIKGTAPSYDLAVIKLNGASGLTAATLGESSSLVVGQPVAAVGSPERLSGTVTAGIISALSRTVTTSGNNGQIVVYNGLQTDAPINPGNSGGPLVNMDGQVVAVNSAEEPGQSSSGGIQSFGLGFSIPIDTAKRVANELMQNGTATKPVLGVSANVDPQSQPSSTDGAQLSDVQPGSAAAQAGLKPGDVITTLDKTPINTYPDLMAEVLKHTPGQQVPVTVKHADGSQQTVTVTLGSTTDTQQTTVSPQQQQQQQNPFNGGGLPGGN